MQEAVNKAASKVTYVIAEDSDILVLLCHHMKPNSQPLFMVSQKSNMKHPIWNIAEISSQLGEECCRYLPFMHALRGCDTTPRLNNIGKGVVLKKTKCPLRVCNAILIWQVHSWGNKKRQEKKHLFWSTALAVIVHLLMSLERKSFRAKSSRVWEVLMLKTCHLLVMQLNITHSVFIIKHKSG